MRLMEQLHILGTAHQRYGLRQNQCYWNAVKTGFVIEEMYPSKDVEYVQGYALHPMSVDDNGLPKLHPHAWLNVDGQIFDPTPAWHNASYMTVYSPVLRVRGMLFLASLGLGLHIYVYEQDEEGFDSRLEMFQEAGFDTTMCEHDY